MEQIRGAIYDTPPDDVVYHLSSVDVILSVEPFERHEESFTAVKYRVDLNRYTKDEYFQKLGDDGSALANGLLDTQAAIAELYESSSDEMLDIQNAIAELYEMVIEGGE